MPHLRSDGGGGRFLDDLLVPALNGTLPLETVHHVAVGIADDLHFHVAGAFQPPFQEYPVVAEGTGRFPAGARHRLGQAVLPFDDAHAAPAAAGGSLDQHGIADAASGGGKVAAVVDLDGLKRRHARFPHQSLGGQFVAHLPDHGGRRADPAQAGLEHGPGEGFVFGQEAVTRVNGLGAAQYAGMEQLVDVQVAFRGRATAEGDGAVGIVDEGRVDIALGIDRHGGYAELARRPDDAAGDLAPVGDEQPGNRLDGPYIRHVPNSLVPSTRLLQQADSDMAMTMRVSRGSIMPSSDTRDVA